MSRKIFKSDEIGFFACYNCLIGALGAVESTYFHYNLILEIFDEKYIVNMSKNQPDGDWLHAANTPHFLPVMDSSFLAVTPLICSPVRASDKEALKV